MRITESHLRYHPERMPRMGAGCGVGLWYNYWYDGGVIFDRGGSGSCLIFDRGGRGYCLIVSIVSIILLIIFSLLSCWLIFVMGLVIVMGLRLLGRIFLCFAFLWAFLYCFTFSRWGLPGFWWIFFVVAAFAIIDLLLRFTLKVHFVNAHILPYKIRCSMNIYIYLRKYYEIMHGTYHFCPLSQFHIASLE